MTAVMGNALDELSGRGPVVPVVVLERAEHAVPLAEALVAGGVRTMEITLRTEAALDSIAAVAKAVPEMLVGAGTVVLREDCQRIADAGGTFLVSPGFHENLHRGSEDSGLPLLPGVSDATDIVQVLQYGYQRLKFFPAVASGGLPVLKALAGPFPQLRFCPTGGIGPTNAAEWLAAPVVMCVGGSWLVPADAIAAGDWTRITELATGATRL